MVDITNEKGTTALQYASALGNRKAVDILIKAKAKIDETLCNGCHICTTRCPFLAIEIINLPEALNKPLFLKLLS